MLFILKRHWTSALLGLAVLSLIGLVLRAFEFGAPIGASPRAILVGLSALGIVLVSDVTLHCLLWLLWGKEYQRRHRELAGAFRDQSIAAILIGALMAGVGEELAFRGASLSPIYLFGGAVLFGLLHHIRRDLWPFTVWAVWQGLLFATALYLTELLFVTMVAHFLHDLIGFLIFRHNNRLELPANSA
jgi:membrane protease YdiL (CAAX protease family)